MNRGVFLSAFLAFALVPFQVFADADGTFTSTAKNKTYQAVLSLKSTEIGSGTDLFSLKGTFSIAKRGKSAATKVTFKLTAAGIESFSEGTGSYKEGGKKKNVRVIVKYDPKLDRFEVYLSSGKFGNFSFLVKRKLVSTQLVGVWFFDGNVAGPMSITSLGDGKLRGSYRGIASQGHGGLVGTLEGKFSSKTWSGKVTITEGGVVVQGTFEFLVQGNAEALKGSFVTTSNVNPNRAFTPLNLTKQ